MHSMMIIHFTEANFDKAMERLPDDLRKRMQGFISVQRTGSVQPYLVLGYVKRDRKIAASYTFVNGRELQDRFGYDGKSALRKWVEIKVDLNQHS